MRNALSDVPKSQQSMVSAALRQAFIQPDRPAASQTLRHVADQLRSKWPKLGGFIDDSEADESSNPDAAVAIKDQLMRDAYGRFAADAAVGQRVFCDARAPAAGRPKKSACSQVRAT